MKAEELLFWKRNIISVLYDSKLILEEDIISENKKNQASHHTNYELIEKSFYY